MTFPGIYGAFLFLAIFPSDKEREATATRFVVEFDTKSKKYKIKMGELHFEAQDAKIQIQTNQTKSQPVGISGRIVLSKAAIHGDSFRATGEKVTYNVTSGELALFGNARLQFGNARFQRQSGLVTTAKKIVFYPQRAALLLKHFDSLVPSSSQ